MNNLLALVALAPLSLNVAIVAAGDAAAGKAKTALCSACHGEDGISIADIWPNLAGQKPGYLVAQLKAFRDGGRSNPIMSALAAPLTDADIEDLAAYYSSLGK
jgi:cytochrome c553